jgi:hypothetical protein
MADVRGTAHRARVESALAGNVPLRDLDERERTAVNDEIAERIRRGAAAAHFGDDLAAAGMTTVSMDDQGRLVERRPDGSTSILSNPDGTVPASSHAHESHGTNTTTDTDAAQNHLETNDNVAEG